MHLDKLATFSNVSTLAKDRERSIRQNSDKMLSHIRSHGANFLTLPPRPQSVNLPFADDTKEGHHSTEALRQPRRHRYRWCKNRILNLCTLTRHVIVTICDDHSTSAILRNSMDADENIPDKKAVPSWFLERHAIGQKLPFTSIARRFMPMDNAELAAASSPC